VFTQDYRVRGFYSLSDIRKEFSIDFDPFQSSPKDEDRFSFQKCCVLLEYYAMDKVQKLGGTKCNVPLLYDV
jgi:hypothetical protein